jgi:hypothetical protein
MTTEEMATTDEIAETDNAVAVVEPKEPTKAEVKAAERDEKIADLRSNESIISKGAKTLRTSIPLMAEALTNIRDGKLYKVAIDRETGKGFKSFDKYLASHEEWGFSRQYASRLINERKDALAIEAGEEPASKTSAKRAAKELTDSEASAKIARSFETFTSRVTDYRDNAGTSDAFRQDFDKAWNAANKAFLALLVKYPAPVEEDAAETAETVE